MKIGIMADSHDNLPLVKKCIDFFVNENIDLLIHAGDYIAPFVLRDFKALPCKKIGVFGNNDGEKKGLLKLMQAVGGEIFEAPYVLSIANRKLAITHDIDFVDEAFLGEEIPDVLIYAHTHEPEVKQENNLLKLNPGESSGWLSGKATVALLNTDTLEVKIEEIK